MRDLTIYLMALTFLCSLFGWGCVWYLHQARSRNVPRDWKQNVVAVMALVSSAAGLVLGLGVFVTA